MPPPDTVPPTDSVPYLFARQPFFFFMFQSKLRFLPRAQMPEIPRQGAKVTIPQEEDPEKGDLPAETLEVVEDEGTPHRKFSIDHKLEIVKV